MTTRITVIGAGPGGYTAAFAAAAKGAEVTLVESAQVGGTCLNRGCIPTKTLKASAEVLEYMHRAAEFGLIGGNGAAVDMESVRARKRRVVDILRGGLEKTCGKLGVHLVRGRGQVISASLVRVTAEDGSVTDVAGDRVILATGSRHRMLGLPREMELTGEGVSYCAVCDGAFYKGKTVAVIGGGNSALQEALLLAAGCSKVYVVQNLPFFTGEERLVQDLKARENVEIILSTVVTALLGDSLLEGIVLKNEETGTESRLAVDGIFVAIGQVADNEPFAGAVALNENGYIISGEDCIPQSEPGIFTAGDCRTKAIRQVTTATADGAVAALAACRFLQQ